MTPPHSVLCTHTTAHAPYSSYVPLPPHRPRSRCVERPEGEPLQDALLLKAVEKAVELDCDIRWHDIAEHLADGAADEEGCSDSEGEGSEGGERGDLLERMAAADARAGGGEEGVFGMEEAVEHLHLAEDRRGDGAKAPAAQPGACSGILLFVRFWFLVRVRTWRRSRCSSRRGGAWCRLGGRRGAGE